MNEKYLGIFTIAFVSLIFIAFFATEITKQNMSVTGFAAAPSPSKGGGVDCWHEGANGREVYLWYLKLATANKENDDVNAILKKNGYANMDALLKDLSSSDKNVVSDAQQVLDLAMEQMGENKKFNFNFQECQLNLRLFFSRSSKLKLERRTPVFIPTKRLA